MHKSLAEQLQAATERLYSAAKNYKVGTNASHQQKLQLKRSCWQEEVPVS